MLFSALFALAAVSAVSSERPTDGSSDKAQPFSDCSSCPQMMPIDGVAKGGTATAVATTETTWAQYLHAVKEKACPAPFIHFRPAVLTDEVLVRSGSLNYPIDHGVSLEKIDCYAEWLSAKSGRRYRLPTEQEWIAFARAGVTTRFPWGDRLERDRAPIRHWVSKVSLTDPFNGAVSHGLPAASFAPNPAGLHDVIGGARELTRTCKQPELNQASNDEKRARGCLLVVKGGSYNSWEDEFGFESRLYVRASSEDPAAGFRLVTE